MNRISTVIIEDEPLAQEKLARMLSRVDKFELLESFSSIEKAVEYIKNNGVDLIFLDINVGEENGMEMLAKEVFGNSKVIVSTAHEEYSLMAFDLNVVDYLLKPYSERRFLQALYKVENTIDHKIPTFIFVKTEHKKVRLNFNEILFFEGMRDYVRIHIKGRRIMTLEKMKYFESVLPKTDFIRIHKSYLIRIDAIDEVEKSMVKIGTNILPIAESKRSEFNRKINI